MNFAGDDDKWKVNEDDTVIVDSSAKKFQAASLKHSWPATIAAICVITFILLAVTVASILLGAEDESAFWLRVPYDLHDVLEESIFVNNSVTSEQWKNSRWIEDEQLVYWDASGGISVYSPITNHTDVLVSHSITHHWHPDEFWPSYDGRYVLLRQPLEFIVNPLQHGAYYAVYDTRESYLIKLRIKTEDLQASLFSHVSWMGISPSLLVIYQNDIYWTDNITSQAWRPVTQSDSLKDPFFYNGLPDWTYSEGIAKLKSLTWTSPHGEWLLYASINSSRCHQLGYIDYHEDRSDANSIRYAIPGGPLPEIELKIVDLENQLENTTGFSHIANHRELVLVEVEWVSPTTFISVWMTRNQNATSIFHCRVTPHTECTEIFLEQAMENHWLKPPGIFPSPRGSGGFIFVSQIEYDEVNGGQILLYFKHPWRKTTSVNLGQITIERIVGWNEDNQTTYFLGASTSARQMRNLYEIRFDQDDRSQIECITCQSTLGDNCNFVDSLIEPYYAQFYELQCLGPSIPSVHVVKTEDHVAVTTLRDVAEEKREVLEHLTPTIQYFDVPLPDGSNGRVQVLLPLSWKNSIYSKLRFPLIVQTLDWNDDEALTDQWRKDWAAYFTVTRQVIYARVSGRERRNQYGTLRHAIEDVLTITRFILSNLNHVESEEVLVIGQGLGGFLSTMVLAKDDENIFRCGIAISPIIDWFRHETTMTERYLGGIKDSHENYVLTKADNFANDIKNDTLMAIDSHSFSPLQQFHTMKLSHLLVKSRIRFQQKIYPRASRKMIQYHSYLTLEHFISQCLYGKN